jgi:carbonic anhydrase
MDGRVPVEAVLGLRPGDAHVIRNAGALATDDALRSIVLSQQLLGTDEVVVLAHTGCAMLTVRDEPLRRELADRTGSEADLSFGGFEDLESNLAEQVERIRSHPWTRDGAVRGLVYELETGRLRTVV